MVYLDEYIHYGGVMEQKDTTMLSWKLIGDFMTDAFVAVGVPREDALLCADVLMESDLRGIPSHGCNRFKSMYIDRITAGIQNPVTEFEVLKDTPTTLVADAHNGMGMVASARAMNAIIEKARKYGMGMAAVRNSTHFGIAGYWATMASNQGLLAITGTNARPSIAPTFGVENMLGTNPLTFSFPTDEEFPFVLDCATSNIQRGKIEYYARAGLDTPEGMVIGNDGRSLTDSNLILEELKKGEAALTPLGGSSAASTGYKGYGYATVVEILSAALQAGSFMKMLTGSDENGCRRPYHLGHFFIVINPEFFMGEESFRKTAGEILRGLRNSRKAPGAERIYTAGEKEYLSRLAKKDTGIEAGAALQEDLITIRDQYHLPYRFPFEK